MGALRQPDLTSSPLKKSPASALDKYGRDPGSPLERLRSLTDYSADTGYSPLYHAMLADLPRLVGSLVGMNLILQILRLSSGQSDGSGRRPTTAPISTAELAELCRCNVRDIQRQLDEMKEREMISVKQIKAGGVKYVLSLRLREWREIKDYAVWKRSQVVAIDEAETEDAAEDEATPAISKGAVKLTSTAQKVRPGRRMRAVKVNTGVQSFAFQNDSETVDLEVSAVVDSGCLVVSTRCAKGAEIEKGEAKANAERHTRRERPASDGKQKAAKREILPPCSVRAEEIQGIFNPLLQEKGAALLTGVSSSLLDACAAVGDCPHDYLEKFVADRGERPINSPLHVKLICGDALASWRASLNTSPAKRGKPSSYADKLVNAAADRLRERGKI